MKKFLIVFLFSLLIGYFVFADDIITISFNPSSVSMIESGGSVDVCVELSEPISTSFLVEWAISGGTATNGIDYSTSGENSLMFEAGETIKCFTVFVQDDSDIEPDEVAKFNIPSISNPIVQIENGEFLLTIINDDMTNSDSGNTNTTGTGNTDSTSNNNDTDDTSIDIMPDFEFIYPLQATEINGKILVESEVENANSIELYYRLPQSSTPVYLGNYSHVGDDAWEYSWDTSLSPNGYYDLFSKIINQYGEYYSSPVAIEIKNIIETGEEEQSLKERVEQSEIEAVNIEKNITTREITTREKLVEETETFTRNIKAVLGVEMKGILEQEVENRLREFNVKTEDKVEEVVESAKRGERIKSEIRLKTQRKNIVMDEIENIQNELAKIRDMKVEVIDGKLKEKVEILEDIMQKKLESKEIELQDILKELNALQGELMDIETERAEFKRLIVDEIIKIIEPTEEVILESQKPMILEAEKEVEKNIESYLKELEINVSEMENDKIEKTQVLDEDSDGDGLSNKEEERLGTSLSIPDSDGDGFLDGTEYITGFDPLDPSSADKIIYEDPRKTRTLNAETYKVERVESIKLPMGGTGIRIEGKGLPNSFVTVHIFSEAIVMTTKTDSSGNWSIVLNKSLADDTHEVYATVTDNQGKITARSDPFVFTKVGEKIAAITLAEISSGGAASVVGALQRVFLFSVIGVITLAFGVALIGISFVSRKKNKKKISKQHN